MRNSTGSAFPTDWELQELKIPEGKLKRRHGTELNNLEIHPPIKDQR